MDEWSDRCTAIRERFDKVLRADLGATTVDLPGHEWLALTRGGPQRLGYGTPHLADGEAQACFSTEVIIASTLWLDDAKLESYLDIVEYVMTRQLARLCDTPDADPDALRRGAEDDLLDLRTDALRWLTEVQMRILDLAIGIRGSAA